ncbi:MAG TPA: SGNH/GDSL hydrolase family protein [Deltaproteobacteria bacterium]|nr:SGNH/GDSL hydrolase family protein [Deltaproteobacteria bacterium]HOI06198.1 SGNH/GDSL hydrolase family protein [Deltaproteobacteria bacterium]
MTVREKRLVIRGGSIAAGCGVERGYARILEEGLSPLGVEVINRSRPRDNSFDGIWTYDEDIEPFAPDLLLIHFGVDDAFYPVYRSEFKENLVRMVGRSRERFSPAFPICIATSHTFDDPYDMDAVNIFYRAIREVAVDLGCRMIPVHTYWAGYLQESGLSNRDLVQADTRLPNGKGHEVLARIIGSQVSHALLSTVQLAY